MGKAAHPRAVVEKSGLMVAQVKGPVSHSFSGWWFSLFPPPKLGRLPKLLIYGGLRGDKGRLGFCGKFL